MNVSLARLPQVFSNWWHAPNVSLPFFGHTQADTVNLTPHEPTVTFKPDPNVQLPAPTAAPAVTPLMAQVQTVNKQTQLAINQITSRSKVLGQPEIQSITKLLDGAQTRLASMEKGADPQTKTFIDGTLKDLQHARQMYQAMDDTAELEKKREDIEAASAKDAQTMKDSVDKEDKAFQDADDQWEQTR